MNPELLDSQVLEKLTKQIVDLLDIKPTPVILIDGPACSGKSTVAKMLQESLFSELEVLPRVISMDDLYPGWEGLRAGSNYLIHNVLRTISQGKSAQWQVWDWAYSERGRQDEPGNGWREFAGGVPLIVEGCGSISRISSELANIRIWVDTDLAVRRERWSMRDQNAFDEYWGIWAAQEDEFYSSEKSEQLADLKFRT